MAVIGADTGIGAMIGTLTAMPGATTVGTLTMGAIIWCEMGIFEVSMGTCEKTPDSITFFSHTYSSWC